MSNKNDGSQGGKKVLGNDWRWRR